MQRGGGPGIPPPPSRNLEIEYGYYCVLFGMFFPREDLNSKFSWEEGVCP